MIFLFLFLLDTFFHSDEANIHSILWFDAGTHFFSGRVINDATNFGYGFRNHLTQSTAVWGWDPRLGSYLNFTWIPFRFFDFQPQLEFGFNHRSEARFSIYFQYVLDDEAISATGGRVGFERLRFRNSLLCGVRGSRVVALGFIPPK